MLRLVSQRPPGNAPVSKPWIALWSSWVPGTWWWITDSLHFLCPASFWLFFRTVFFQAQFKSEPNHFIICGILLTLLFMRNWMENMDNNSVMDLRSKELQCQLPCQTSVTAYRPLLPTSIRSIQTLWVPVIESTKQGFSGLHIQNKCRHQNTYLLKGPHDGHLPLQCDCLLLQMVIWGECVWIGRLMTHFHNKGMSLFFSRNVIISLV